MSCVFDCPPTYLVNEIVLGDETYQYGTVFGFSDIISTTFIKGYFNLRNESEV